MNEKQIQAQFDALIEQRNTAMNQVVNMAGQLAILKAEVENLKAQLSLASSLVSEAVVEDMPA